MKSIERIVSAYVSLNDEGRLLALKAQRLKVLAMSDDQNPFFAKVRGQCLEDLAVIEAGLSTFCLFDPEGLTCPPPVNFADAEDDGPILNPDIEVFDNCPQGKEGANVSAIHHSESDSDLPERMRDVPPDIYINFFSHALWEQCGSRDISASCRVKVERSSDAWQVDAAGNWTRVPPHTPALSDRGLAVWEKSVNLVVFSSAPTVVNGWVLENSTTSLRAGSGPGLGLDAHLYDDGHAPSRAHRLSSPANIDLKTAATYTVSLFVKHVSADFIQIILPGAAFGESAYANFDIQRGALGSVGSSAKATIVSFSNGWLKCEVTATTSSAASEQGVDIQSIPAIDSLRAAEFDGASRQFLVWNCQVEEKAASTPPIVTAGYFAAREADVVFLADLPRFGTSYTVWAKGRPEMPSTHSNVQTIIELFADEGNRSSLRRNAGTGGAYTAIVGDGGGSTSPHPAQVWSQYRSGTLASAFAPRDQALAFDGVLATASYASLSSTPTSVIVGSGYKGTNFWWNGDVEEIAIWFTQRVPNANLRTISSQYG